MTTFNLTAAAVGLMTFSAAMVSANAAQADDNFRINLNLGVPVYSQPYYRENVVVVRPAPYEEAQRITYIVQPYGYGERRHGWGNPHRWASPHWGYARSHQWRHEGDDNDHHGRR